MIMFRISQSAQQPVVDVDLVGEIEPAIRSSKPGRYHIDQIERDVLPSGYTSRRWSVATEFPDGPVALDPDPWDA
jgi:hypothetical protein